MNATTIKSAAVDKIAADYGIWINRRLSVTIISKRVEELTGRLMRPGQKPAHYLELWVNPIEVRERHIPAFRPLTRTHPRLADIERAQPPMMTPNGVGNDRQYREWQT